MLGVPSSQLIALTGFAVGFFWVWSSLTAHRLVTITITKGRKANG